MLEVLYQISRWNHLKTRRGSICLNVPTKKSELKGWLKWAAFVLGFMGFITIFIGVKSGDPAPRSEEHTSELQSQSNLVCRLLLEKKKKSEDTPTAALGFAGLGVEEAMGGLWRAIYSMTVSYAVLHFIQIDNRPATHVEEYRRR